MNSSERADFDTLMKKLCVGLGALPSPDRLQIFFEGLAKMSLIQFSRVVDACLDEDSACNGKLPTVPAVWKIWRGIREKERARTARPIDHKGPQQSKSLMLVNSMFLNYIYLRRVVQKTPRSVNIDIDGRRVQCLKLVEFLEASQAEDLYPSLDEVKAMFQRAMERISDFTPETEGA